jgi:RNA polymerase sigma-70 factor (ECF subfamily)
MVDAAHLRLIKRAREGDKAAYESLLEPAAGPGARLAYSMLQDRSEAEDAVQEAALRAWRKLDKLRPGSEFRPWFLGIVANQCRTVRRGRWFSLQRQADPEGSTPSIAEHVVRDADLERALNRLGHNYRVVILMHFYLDLSLADVAAASGLSIPAVKSRINRALKRLRPFMETTEAMA